jgi:hypothetical protein
LLHEKFNQEPNTSSASDLDECILEILLDCYQAASEVNNKPLFRNFLWNNEFFKGEVYLPGLMKQELRAY